MVSASDEGRTQQSSSEAGPSLSVSRLKGSRFEIVHGEEGYPEALLHTPDPPRRLYGVGNPETLGDGLAIIGARKATPYGRATARRFSSEAAEHGITVVSGGALGCDSQAHEGALGAGGTTVVVLGGGCDRLYPARNACLFQRVIDAGGAVVSEHPWDFPPMPYAFRARNRIIAGLTRATLIVEAGLPSGTFSTADDALAASREVWAVPGPITSPTSQGANRLIYQGAAPVVDEETFEDLLGNTFGCLRIEDARPPSECICSSVADDALLAALMAEPLRIEQMLGLPWEEPEPASGRLTWIMLRLASYERDGLIARFPDGRYGPSQV